MDDIRARGAFPLPDEARQPQVAEQLKGFITERLAKAEDPEFDRPVVGIVAPHLDYGRGGENYAAAYKCFETAAKDLPDRIVVLGTNHFGHFALTGRLLPLLKAAPAARLITTSSVMHKMGRIDFDNLDGLKSYNPWTAYAQSKLANLLFAYEVDRKLKASGSKVSSLASHPGMSYTNLVSVGPEMKGAVVEKNVSSFFVKLVAQTAAQGTLPGLYAAVATELKGGEYVGPDGLLEMRGYPVVVSSSKKSYEEDAARRLWEVSEQRTGVTF
jgi:NAD(P)-dependent dehydrogenase (short-subunit alcohol dehydrogenase family)